MKTLLLVDGSSYLYRAFYALTHLTAPDGMPTNAIYGVLKMLNKLRDDTPHDYCACVFDAKGKNFRHALFPDYKATRPPMPDALRPQAEILPELVQLMGWNVLKINDVEADDVIGTLAIQAAAQGMNVIISTGDKDMAQLVNHQITLVNTMKNETLNPAGVLEKFGVRPNQIRDFLALMGDKVDNVPGIEKCGEKTAAKWLAEFGSLDEIMRRADEFKGKIGENLRAALPQLPLSYELVTIKTDVDLSAELPHGIDDLGRKTPNWAQLIPQFRALGFKTWLKEAESHVSGSPNDLSTAPPKTVNKPIFRQPEISHKIAAKPQQIDYQTIDTPQKLTDLLAKLSSAAWIGLDTETTSLDPMQARLVGISVSWAFGMAAYIPLSHTFAESQLSTDLVLNSLKPLLENESLGKIGQNLKYDQHVFKNHGIDLKGIVGDSMLASYIVESHLKHNLDDLAARWLDEKTTIYEDLCGKGTKQIPFTDVSVANATAYAWQDADFALRIERHLRGMMNTQQIEMYEQMELPVAQVLFQMERNGVQVDRVELAQQSAALGEELLQLEQQAFELAGQPFNLNSPKQLQEILFNKLGIPTKGLKKTKTGISTDESVLEKLADDYPLPKVILQNRSLAKLKSTYTDKLPEMINPQTGRIHTNYAQAVAITGRLASNNPNLQNIPIRTEQGRKVRRAFTAPDGYVIVSADYSQIELRIMAHLSGDETLQVAFQSGEDVHRRTAAEVFGVVPEKITSEQRRYAKTINFGLIYGMGEFGLAKALGIDNVSAKMFIQRYFARYVGVAEYMERTKEQAKQQGFVETLFGRKLYLPDIHAKNAAARASAERAAINAPMQGTASDLIKRAMIAVQDFLNKNQLKTLLIMQVHDELVLQVHESELDLITDKLPKIMASVGDGILNVPLLAQVGVGANWEDAH